MEGNYLGTAEFTEQLPSLMPAEVQGHPWTALPGPGDDFWFFIYSGGRDIIGR